MKKFNTPLPTSFNNMPTAVDNDPRDRSEEKQTRNLRSMLVQSSFALLFLVVCLFVYKDIVNDTTTMYGSSPPVISGPSSTKTSTKSSTQTSTMKASSAASIDNPNIVFIYVDDMGYGSIGRSQYDLYGMTPFLNSLIDDGLFFNNYYAQEECTPSRASLMTGRYPISTGTQYYLVQPALQWGLNLTETLFPEILRDYGGYKTYGIGKWHLGHFSPDYLPVARGFDEYVGYLTGEIGYWSKMIHTSGEYFHDFTYMNDTCYHPYANMSDTNTYSTKLIMEKAVDVVRTHNFNAKPMFMYLPFQAVHDPFSDFFDWTTGLNSSVIDPVVYDEILNRIPGSTRQQYAFSLFLLDRAVRRIYESIKEINQLDNTLFIVAADNGGCYNAGGRNGDLRGCKGTLMEGGLKVNAFMYGPKILPMAVQGTNYTNLFHVSDWFPTLMGLLNIDYTPDDSIAWDGVDHSQHIKSWNAQGHADEHGENGPRSKLVYNIYYNVDKKVYNETTVPYAVRNLRYKLVRTYIDNHYTTWYNFSTVLDQDDDLDRGSCTQDFAATGTFDTMLFDLWEDPNETNDLYETVTETTYPEAYAAKVELEAYFASLLPSIVENTYSGTTDTSAITYWETKDNYILPWTTGTSSLAYCDPLTTFSTQPISS